MANFNSLMSNNFIEYASYVIKDRAIPDINDGLKPVQRRIFHSMQEMDDGKFNKVANVVGNTMKYHPHGDASIYSALVVMANKELFIDRQGNFGNIFTGDEASAARYIECRLSPLAREILFNKDLTEYVDSYDGRNKEPITFPAKLPVLLLLGAEGIAVGMSTKILPHNFNELLNAQIAILEGREFAVYPDFIQGGFIDVSDYQNGNGKVRIRAKIEIANEKTVIVKDLPYGITTETLISSIDTASKRGKIKISSINDYTAEKVEIEIKTARGEYASDLINALYAYTDCEISVSVNLIAIQDNKPRQFTVDEVLRYNTDKLKSDLNRELEIEEAKLEQKLHDLTLEQIFIENRIYKTIEEVTLYEEVIGTIMKEMNRYKKLFIRELTVEDVEKLLEIRIKRISRYDIDKQRKNIDDIVRLLEQVRKNLKNVKAYTIKYLKNKLKQYGADQPRRTKIIKMENLSKMEIKQPDIKVSWDKTGGFLGTGVKGGDETFTVKPSDKFILFQKKGIFKVISIEDKAFIDTDVLHLEVYDGKMVYSVIYTDLDSKLSYVKKFQMARFLTNKEYKISPFANNRIDFLSTNTKAKPKVYYVKKPKQKINQEVYEFENLDIKGYGVRGNKLSNKELSRVR